MFSIPKRLALFYGLDEALASVGEQCKIMAKHKSHNSQLSGAGTGSNPFVPRLVPDMDDDDIQFDAFAAAARDMEASPAELQFEQSQDLVTICAERVCFKVVCQTPSKGKHIKSHPSSSHWLQLSDIAVTFHRLGSTGGKLMCSLDPLCAPATPTAVRILRFGQDNFQQMKPHLWKHEVVPTIISSFPGISDLSSVVQDLVKHGAWHDSSKHFRPKDGMESVETLVVLESLGLVKSFDAVGHMEVAEPDVATRRWQFTSTGKSKLVVSHELAQGTSVFESTNIFKLQVDQHSSYELLQMLIVDG